MSGPRRTLLLIATLAALLGSCVAFFAMQPASFRIARTRTVSAPAARVHAVLSDVRRFAAWDPWPARRGPVRFTTFSPTTAGRGAWVEWSRSDGTTRSTIVVDTPTQIELRDDVDGRVGASRQVFVLAARARGTVVTWALIGDNDLLRRVLWPFVALDRRVGPGMEASLARLDAASSTP